MKIRKKRELPLNGIEKFGRLMIWADIPIPNIPQSLSVFHFPPKFPIFSANNYPGMKSIIIDDEEQSHVALKRLLENHVEIQVAASGYNVADGVRLIREQRPGLVFLDIEMPDGTGFDLLQQVDDPSGFVVVFITAHNQYAVTAIRSGALDYLLKPVSAAALAEALDRMWEKIKEGIAVEQLRQVVEAFQQLQEQKLPARMIVRTQEKIHFVPVDEIKYLKADGGLTEIHRADGGKRLVVTLNLGAYEEQFRPYRQFMRVHRKHIVNLLMVDHYDKGEVFLMMQDGSKIDVSRDNREELLERMREL
jgi:two-component system, LytTR family, response regulator